MKVLFPVIGKSGEIGELKLEDQVPPQRTNRPRARVDKANGFEEIVYDDHWYKLERLLVRLDAPKDDGVYQGREARLLVYVHEEFLGHTSAKRLEELDKFIWTHAGTWFFSYAVRFDTRPQLGRWKP